MKIITLNVRGIGVEGKLGWIKSIIRDERLDVIGLQETVRVQDHWNGYSRAKPSMKWKGQSQ
ncbi:transposon TX1, partial [Tanacetum coccineum]